MRDTQPATDGELRIVPPVDPAPAGRSTGRLAFRVLGPLEVDGDDGPVELGGPKQRAVLAHLLLRANEVVPAETLLDELWGEEPPETARNIIQTYVSLLRKALGRDRIERHAPGYRLRLDPGELDAARFDALLRDARKALPVDPEGAVGSLDDGLALWRGPALADLADQPALAAEATRLDGLRLEAQEDRVDALLACGRSAAAIGALEGLIAQHPLRERPWGMLMLADYREGRQADALAAYQRLREVLADELGIDPSPELTRLYEQILRQDPGLDLRGEALRGYRLLERIGEGHDGAVFRAIQPHVGRDVAVRIVEERLASDPGFVSGFERRAQAIAALEHPHIAPVYDHWREPGRAYVVTRYLKGGSLASRLQRDPALPHDLAARVVEQIASAIGFAHRSGVAHGKLSPANVLFDGEGNAYVIDLALVEPPDGMREDEEALARIARALLGDDAPRVLGSGAAAPDAEARNPFKGLRAFTEADARDFFGRGELVARLASAVEDGARFLAIVGPSGSGKSSLVRAGVVPALREGPLAARGLFVADLFPGSHPTDELEAALMRIAVGPVARLDDLLGSGSRGLLDAVDRIVPPGAELLLVVDQFEEVFTLCADAGERERFIESLRVATVDPDSRLRVIVTLRADHYDRPLEVPRFGELLARRTEAVTPLTPDELEQAIRRPAEAVGVTPEPGLVAEIIADVAHQPGALPLLQYALTELFERREGDRLTLPPYREIGGVAGAVAAKADRIVDALDEGGRHAARQLFLRLVTLGEGREDTRRRVTRSELDGLGVDPSALESAIDTFSRHRLLTFDRDAATREPTVEIAHEALLGAWGRLRRWIDDAREDLRRERRLARSTGEWRAADRDPSFLLRGAQLEQVEVWASTTDLVIAAPERAYLHASLSERAREHAAEETRRRHEAEIERRSATRLRWLVAVFAVAALVASSLTLVAVGQRQRVVEEARVSTARELANASIASLEEDPERAVLLAIEAVETTREVDGTVLPEAEDALHRAVGASRIIRTLPGIGGVVDRGEGILANADPATPGTITIRDDTTGEALRSFPAHDGGITGVEFSRDATMLATTGEDGFLRVWDPETGDPLAGVSGPTIAWLPSFSEDGSRIAAAWLPVAPFENTEARTLTQVVDVETGEIIWRLRRNGAGRPALSPDGRVVASVRWGGRADPYFRGQVFPVEGHGPTVEFEEGPYFVGGESLWWSREGRYLAQPVEPEIRIVDAATGELTDRTLGHTDTITDVDWGPGGRLATGSADGTTKVWTVARGVSREIVMLAASGDSIDRVSYAADGTEVMTHDAAGNVRIWDVATPAAVEAGAIASANHGMVGWLPGGELVGAGRTSLLVGDADGGSPRAFGPAYESPAVNIGPVPTAPRFAISPTGDRLAWIEGSVSMRDTATGDVLATTKTEGAVAWGPGGELAVTTGASVKVFDHDGVLIRTVRPGIGTIIAVGVDADGTVIAAGAPDVDGCVDRIWHEGRAGSSEVPACSYEVVLDPSGGRIVTLDGAEPRIWDVANGVPSAILPARPAYPSAVAFSPDGSTIATGDGASIRLIDAATGDTDLTLRGHGCAVVSVAFDADGSHLASGTTCDAARAWILDLDELLDAAHASVTRTLTDAECRRYLHTDGC